MSQESLQESIERPQLEAAIQAVKDKGWDVNPFTVAEEARVVPSCITRNGEFMQILIAERGGDVSFLPRDEELLKRNSELEATVQDLEKENNSLATRLAEGEEPKQKTAEEQMIEEQMKALLTSESDAQVKALEQELEQAYTQVLDLEEEQRELTRSVTGLEKVNEALNVRLRELEAERDTLQTGAAAPSADLEEEKRDLTRSLAGLERVNEALNTHIREVEAQRDAALAAQQQGGAGQSADFEEERRDMSRSIAGLERVNEALNSRLRELEAERAELIKQQGQGSESADGRPSTEENETIKLQLTARAEELMNANRTLAAQVTELEARNQELTATVGQHEGVILELEAKLAELQQEADMLALQLQNAFNVGYQKAMADKEQLVPEVAQVEAVQQPNYATPQESFAADAPFNAAPPVAEAAPEIFQPAEPVIEVPAAADDQGQKEYATHAYDEAEGGWGSEERIHNFARTGPYVASEFNPLESLTWRDLETVYSMGVLSIKDFSRNLGEYNAPQSGSRDSEETGETLAAGSNNGEDGRTTLPPAGSVDARSAAAPPPPPPPRQQSPRKEQAVDLPDLPKGELDFIDPNDVLDLDKLDIFENLEDLEDLNSLQAMYQPLNISFEDQTEDQAETGDRVPIVQAQNRIGTETGETPAVGEESGKKPSDEELRQLISSRIAKEQERPADEKEEKKRFAGSNKFVGGKGGKSADDNDKVAPETKSSTAIPAIPTKAYSPEVRKACGLLGLRPDELTKELINAEWKKQFAANHPDLGGDKETAIALNEAKTTLLRFLDQNTPKLGTKFGKKKQD